MIELYLYSPCGPFVACYRVTFTFLQTSLAKFVPKIIMVNTATGNVNKTDCIPRVTIFIVEESKYCIFILSL
jgi:hypothetical protein